jgi:hypothetical protein
VEVEVGEAEDAVVGEVEAVGCGDWLGGAV